MNPKLPQEVVEMTMEDAELGRLTKDHLHSHAQVSKYKAELEQVGDDLILLGNNLKKNSQNIRVGEAKVTLKSDRNEDRTVLWSRLDIADVFQTVEKLKQANEVEQQLARQINEAGMGYIVDGLESRKAPIPDMLTVPTTSSSSPSSPRGPSD